MRFRNFASLAIIQTSLNALVIVCVAAAFAGKQNPGISQPELVIGTSLVAIAYFASGYQILKNKSQAAATAILSVLTIINVGVLIAQSGGFDSPYYALWLAAIVIASLFGVIYTIGLTIATLGLFVVTWTSHGSQLDYLLNHRIQLLFTIATAGLVELIHWQNSRRVQKKDQTTEHLESQLSEENFKAQTLVNAMTEGVAVIDAAGVITLFNPAAEQLTGWTALNAVGLEYHTVLNFEVGSEKGANQPADPLAQALNQHQAITSTDTILIGKTDKRNVEVSATPVLDANTQPTGALIVFSDITKQKQLERQKDEFVSTASHEMRTPVAAIEGYLSLAMNPKVAQVDDRAKTYLNKAHDSTQHLGSLFKDLLTITKMEDGMEQLPREPVELTALITSLVGDMQFSAQQKGLQLSVATPPANTKVVSPEIYVSAGAERLREVVMNLIENAIKYTPKGAIQVSATADTSLATITVRDTGPGIGADDIPHLFEKFYRAASTSAGTRGTGLGLYLCRSVVEAYGGKVWVESKVGEGSSFHIQFPRMAAAEVTHAKTAEVITPTVQ